MKSGKHLQWWCFTKRCCFKLSICFASRSQYTQGQSLISLWCEASSLKLRLRMKILLGKLILNHLKVKKNFLQILFWNWDTSKHSCFHAVSTRWRNQERRSEKFLEKSGLCIEQLQNPILHWNFIEILTTENFVCSILLYDPRLHSPEISTNSAESRRVSWNNKKSSSIIYFAQTWDVRGGDLLTAVPAAGGIPASVRSSNGLVLSHVLCRVKSFRNLPINMLLNILEP